MTKSICCSRQDAVRARVKQIKNLIAETEMDYEREKLNERVARLSGGVAIIQVRGLDANYQRKSTPARFRERFSPALWHTFTMQDVTCH